MSYQARKGAPRHLNVEDVAQTCRWSEAVARRYMGEMLRVVNAPGEPVTVTRAALERWLVRNCDRAVGPALMQPIEFS